MIPHVLAGLGFLVPAQTTCAGSIGLLLGVADHGDLELGSESPCPQRLHTYWIKWDRGRAVLSGDFADIVVPREGAGFSRVGISRTCGPLETGKEDLRCDDSLSVTPLDGAPPAAGGGRKCGHTLDPCAYGRVALTFVSPSHLALLERRGSSETCEPRGWHWTDARRVRKLDGREPLGFGSLGPLAGAAYARAAERAVSTLTNETRAADDPCRADPSHDVGWGIRRARTEWKASLFQQSGLASCQAEGDIDWHLDAGLLGYREPRVEWARVLMGHPKAEQAFSSPGGELLLLVSPGSIELVRADERRDERPLLVLPREEVVMVQWATGRGVRTWSRALDSRTGRSGGSVK